MQNHIDKKVNSLMEALRSSYRRCVQLVFMLLLLLQQGLVVGMAVATKAKPAAQPKYRPYELWWLPTALWAIITILVYLRTKNNKLK